MDTQTRSDLSEPFSHPFQVIFELGRPIRFHVSRLALSRSLKAGVLCEPTYRSLMMIYCPQATLRPLTTQNSPGLFNVILNPTNHIHTHSLLEFGPPP